MSACLGLFSAVCFVVSAGESLAGGFAGRRLWCGFGFRFVVTSICLF